MDEAEEVVVEPVLDEEMVVALPAGHPLASEPVLPLTALRNETVSTVERGSLGPVR